MSDKTTNNKRNNKIGLRIFLLATIIVASVVPVFRGYMANSGESLLWCLRIARVIPVQLVEPVCLIGIAILRAGIILVAYAFFSIINRIHNGYWMNVFSGVILFGFSPYQLYIAYDKVDLTDMLLWIFILLFFLIALLIMNAAREKKTGTIVLFSFLEMITIAGMIITYLISYVGESTLSFGSKGYVFGEMFTTFFYTDDHPGFGIALFFAVCIWIYHSIIGIKKKNDSENEKDSKKTHDYISIVFVSIALACLILSSINFPWDSIIRDIPIAGKIINRLEAPTIFFGLSGFCFCIPAVRGLSIARKGENEFVSKILPVIVIFLAVAGGLFLMSDYMYWQYPLGFVNM